MLTCIEVSLGDLEWWFLVGDQVHVMLGENKGRIGSIVGINDGVSTIKQTANEVIEVNLTLYSSSFITHFTQFKLPLLYLESHDLAPSFTITPHLAASLMSKPMPSHKPEALKGHQMLGRCDPQIGREAAVYVAHIKGYQGQLVDISQNSGTIECPWHQLPRYMALLNHLILMCHNINLMNIVNHA